MTNLIAPPPEWLVVANTYIQTGSIKQTADELNLPETTITEALAQRETRAYLDAVYLDLGYRNRDRLGKVLDKMIDSKLAEAEESGVYSNKDLADLLMMAHKMRMEEIKATAPTGPTTQTNIQVNGYSKLMETLLGS